MKVLTVRLFWMRAVLSAAVSGLIVLQSSGSLSAAPSPESGLTVVEGTDGEKEDEKKEEKKGTNKKGTHKKKKKATTRALSVDELYIQDMLEEYLRPTKIKFLADGGVRMLFDFGTKSDEHVNIFNPPVAKKVNSVFRWSLPREESYYYYYHRPAEKDKDGKYIYYRGGLRISDQGMAVLKCWFEDDVEAKISFGSGTNFIRSQTASLVFYTKGGKALASNFGSQCVIYRKGKATRSRKGKPESMLIYSKADFGLVVKDGEFEAHRNGRRKSSMEYSTKAFKSGMIGFVWDGRLAGVIYRLEIKGKLDVPTMAKEMRKAMRRRK